MDAPQVDDVLKVPAHQYVNAANRRRPHPFDQLTRLVFSAGAADHDVTVPSNVFTPGDISIALGDSVTWTNVSGFHNVSAADASFRSGEPANPPSTFQFTFNTPGDFGYSCEIRESTSSGILRR